MSDNIFPRMEVDRLDRFRSGWGLGVVPTILRIVKMKEDGKRNMEFSETGQVVAKPFFHEASRGHSG